LRRFFTLCVVAFALCGLVAAPAVAQGGDDDEPTIDTPSGGGGAPEKGKGYEDTIELAIDDIREFWADEFAAQYPGLDYEEVTDDEIYAMSPGSDGPSCGGTELGYSEVEMNAQYARCNTGEKFIWWDDEQLFPQFYRDHGEYSIALVLAHEWGHAIQDQYGGLGVERSIILELQADCFAGAWTQRVQDGDSEVELQAGDLDGSISALLQVADPVGNDPEADNAHGNAFDRVTSFQLGLDNGAEGCVGYTDPATPPTITEITFQSQTDADTGGNVPAEDVVTIAVDLLNDFYSQTASDVYEPLTIDDVGSYDGTGKKSQLPMCNGVRVKRSFAKARVFYCLADGYLAFDQEYLGTVYDNIGDFGVVTLFANAWATYVQTLQDFPGVEDNDVNAVLGADCYTGSFAEALRLKEDGSGGLVSTTGGEAGEEITYTLSPGDLDETIQAFIDYNAARGVGRETDFSFIRIYTFRDGFLNSYDSCAQWADPDVIDELESTS
jgi:predicted metalloprotease